MIESPGINLCTYGRLVFDKGGKNIELRKYSLFSKQCSENWTATYKRMKLEYFLTPYTKIKSKWTKALNINSVTITLLVGNTGKTLIIVADPFVLTSYVFFFLFNWT